MSVKEPKVIRVATKLTLENGSVNLTDFYDHFYEVKKFQRWFNVLPAVWIEVDRKRFEAGCNGCLCFSLPPFFYQLTCTKSLPNERIELQISGLLNGNITITFSETSQEITMVHLLDVVGKNAFLHYYYKWMLCVHHEFFMNWRYAVLKKRLLKKDAI